MCTKQWQKSGPLDIWNWTECISCEISGTQRALLRPAWPWLFFSIQEPQNYEEMSFGALKITRYIYCLFHFFLLDLICLAQERERERYPFSMDCWILYFELKKSTELGLIFSIFSYLNEFLTKRGGRYGLKLILNNFVACRKSHLFQFPLPRAQK